MAKTHSKPGPKPKYGDREEIHVLVPVDDLEYIRSVTGNVTGWVIQAIQAKRQADTQPRFLPGTTQPVKPAMPMGLYQPDDNPYILESYPAGGEPSNMRNIADPKPGLND